MHGRLSSRQALQGRSSQIKDDDVDLADRLCEASDEGRDTGGGRAVALFFVDIDGAMEETAFISGGNESGSRARSED